MSDESESSSDASDTYAQIVVPSYDLEDPVTTAAKGGTTTGSSFLRLGSFPSLSETAEQPSGFAKSLALAQLVGGTATTYAQSSIAGTLLETGDDTGPTGDYNLLTTDTYAGDSTLFLGFADDTRLRDGAYEDAGTLDASKQATDDAYIDWTYVENTVANRQAETGRLLFKGGWWDHSDGNRITTTCGDKIEVIQGNYKMIVLGRQAPTQGSSVLSYNSVVTDLSGGQALESCFTPGAGAVAIEYVEKDGIWTTYEEGSGNTVAVYNGNQEYYNTGQVYNTYIGASPEHSADKVKKPSSETDPVMISKTWAQKIETYYGSGGKPVPIINSYTDAGVMNSVTNAGAINSTTNSAVMNSVTIGLSNSVSIGNVAGLVIGANEYCNIGPSVQGYIGPYIQYSLVSDVYLGAAKTEVVNEDAKIANLTMLVAEMDTDLTNMTLRLRNDVTLLQNTQTSLSEEVTELNGVVTVIADEVGFV